MILNFPRARHQSFILKIPNRQENIGTWFFISVFSTKTNRNRKKREKPDCPKLVKRILSRTRKIDLLYSLFDNILNSAKKPVLSCQLIMKLMRQEFESFNVALYQLWITAQQSFSSARQFDSIWSSSVPSSHQKVLIIAWTGCYRPLQKREGTGASFLYWLDWKSKD